MVDYEQVRDGAEQIIKWPLHDCPERGQSLLLELVEMDYTNDSLFNQLDTGLDRVVGSG